MAIRPQTRILGDGDPRLPNLLSGTFGLGMGGGGTGSASGLAYSGVSAIERVAAIAASVISGGGGSNEFSGGGRRYGDPDQNED